MRTSRLILLATVCTVTLAAAQPHQHTTPAPPPVPATPAGAPHAAHGTDHLGTLSGAALDRMYLSMMITHHEAAVQMSEAALQRARDARVRAWALEVLRAQQSEIREMTAMLTDFRLGAPDAQAQAAMRRDMQGMVDAVQRGPNPDEAWVQGMVRHHALALQMATAALTGSGNDQIRMQARGVVRVQADQIYEYRNWQPDR